jgi:hypothetical protein
VPAWPPTRRSAQLARPDSLQLEPRFEPISVDEEIASYYAEVLAVARWQRRSTRATELRIISTAATTGRTLSTGDNTQTSLARVSGVPVNP